MAVRRLFVEKKREFDNRSKAVISNVKEILGVTLEDVRVLIRYDIEGITVGDLVKARGVVFSEPPVDLVYDKKMPDYSGYKAIAVEFLPGQFDQRADSAAACIELLLKKKRPIVRCATVYLIKGATAKAIKRIKGLLINPVEAREASLKKPSTLTPNIQEPEDVKIVAGFRDKSFEDLTAYHKEGGYAMSVKDLEFVRDYFRVERRDPYITELKVIDTYWSDHCRHTTFLTELVKIEDTSGNPYIRDALKLYKELFAKFNKNRDDKYPCLMDIATIGAKEVRLNGGLNNLDISEEINACSIKADVDVSGKKQKYLIMFKNETHNHPTEIEPFGGAATCLGGAIRDPLSGRSYVYQSMRVTGAGNILDSYDKTLKGKLPQRVITSTATAGFSSYGNQIGLATGMVAEVYHPGYVAKRLETGFVIGAVPERNVVRNEPSLGDKIILLGGETGRDGCGGATGSSKAHTAASVEECGAEVQKGNPLTERKIQRLFRDSKVTRMIKRCNDFGAGGVSVAIGELAESLDIYLDLVPKKYEGLDGTEIAISESQERMAVVVKASDVNAFLASAAKENLNAVVVAEVTNSGRMRMYHKTKCIVDLKRDMLNTNGVKQTSEAVMNEGRVRFFGKLDKATATYLDKGDFKSAVLNELSRINVCSNKGMSETFDSSIGAGTVLMPFGGKYQITPSVAMAAKVPVLGGETSTVTVASYGFNPHLMSENSFIGSVYSVLLSVIKAVSAGAPLKSIRLTLQEFFKRLGTDSERWGQPVAALLGALYTQVKLNIGAIGGKDSMSGTFEKMDVPPTLISFAVGITDTSRIVTNILKGDEESIYRISLKRDMEGMPDLDYAAMLLKAIDKSIENGKISFINVAEDGGAAVALVKSALGNRIGIKFHENKVRNGFLPSLGDIVFAGDVDGLSEFNPEKFATVAGNCIEIGGNEIDFEMAESAYLKTLSGIFPVTAESEGCAETYTYEKKNIIIKKNAVARPKVLIPVFPGTNCEYDTAASFERAGADVFTYIVKNRTPQEITKSARELAKNVGKVNIIAFPGGFSGGDEPDGSGKFIAATFSNPMIADAVHELLYNKDGLILGICNGFQALIKLGLLPFGKIKPLEESSATLTFNNIARHVSTICRVRYTGCSSPWLCGIKAGDVFNVAVSHGEGKLIAPSEVLEKIAKSGQIATQYVNFDNKAAMTSPFNPNGSSMAIEGIISPDGRILGKMGHSERIGEGLYKNVDGNYDMQIFQSAVKYFK